MIKTNNIDYLRRVWIKHITQVGKVSLFIGFLLGIISFFLSKAQVNHLPSFILLMLIASALIFVVFTLTNILPNYIFYLKLIKLDKEQYIIDNIEKYGMNSLMKKLWFIWPKDPNGRSGKK